LSQDIVTTLRSPLVVARRIERELAKQFSVFGQHSDVQIGDEDQNRGKGAQRTA